MIKICGEGGEVLASTGWGSVSFFGRFTIMLADFSFLLMRGVLVSSLLAFGLVAGLVFFRRKKSERTLEFRRLFR